MISGKDLFQNIWRNQVIPATGQPSPLPQNHVPHSRPRIGTPDYRPIGGMDPAEKYAALSGILQAARERRSEMIERTSSSMLDQSNKQSFSNELLPGVQGLYEAKEDEEIIRPDWLGPVPIDPATQSGGGSRIPDQTALWAAQPYIPGVSGFKTPKLPFQGTNKTDKAKREESPEAEVVRNAGVQVSQDGQVATFNPVITSQELATEQGITPPQPQAIKQTEEGDVRRTSSVDERKAAAEWLYGDKVKENEEKYRLYGPQGAGAKFLQGVADYASRGIYSTSGFAKSAMDEIGEGEAWTRIWDDAFKGAGRGFLGEDQVTPGELVQMVSDLEKARVRGEDTGEAGFIEGLLANVIPGAATMLGSQVMGKPAGQLDAAFDDDNGNWLTNNMRRAGGAHGEIFADPMDLLTFGSLGVVQNSTQLLSRGARTANSTTDASKAIDEITEAASKQLVDDPGAVIRGVSPETGMYGGNVTITERAKYLTNRFYEDTVNAGQVKTGTQGGKKISINEPANRSSMIGNYAMAAREGLYQKFDSAMLRLDSAKGRFTWGSPEYKRLVKNDKAMAAYDANRTRELNKLNKRMNALDPEYGRAIDEIERISRDVGRKVFDEQIDAASEVFEKGLSQRFYNDFSIRIGPKGHKVVIPTYIGRAWNATAKKPLSKSTHSRAAKSLSSQKTFGSQGSQIIANIRRNGVVDFQELSERLKPFAKVTRSKADREHINRLLQSNYNDATIRSMDDVSDEVADAVDFIRKEYRKMFDAEINNGVRKGTAKAPENYHYIWNKKQIIPRKSDTKFKGQARSLTEKRTEFKKLRKQEASSGNLTTDWMQRAKEMGLNPETDPFQNLLYREQKSGRDMSRGWLMQELINSYGIKGRALPEQWLRKTRLRHIASDAESYGPHQAKFKIGQEILNSTKKGEKWYLPDDVAEIYSNFHNLTSLNLTEEAGAFFRIYDSAMKFFKFSATVPMPGFHVKNMAGDFFMGALDGVRHTDYLKFTNNYRNKTFKMPNGQVLSYDEFKHVFDNYAGASNYASAELGMSLNVGKQVEGFQDAARVGFKGAGRGLVKGSEMREDFGRMVHFWKALQEEAAAGGTKKIDIDKVISNSPTIKRTKELEDWHKMAIRAGSRVDYYKFDYNALTRFEKEGMRRMVPFYTFTRKALPVILESILMNPAAHGKIGRFYEGDDGVASIIPDWLNEIGYANIGGGGNPMILPNTFLPTDVVSAYVPDDITNAQDYLKSARNFFDNPVANLMIEGSSGRSQFSGAPLSTNGLVNMFGQEEKGSEELSNRGVALNVLGTMFPPANTVHAAFTSDTAKENLTGRLLTGLAMQEVTPAEQHNVLDSKSYQYQEWEGRVNKKLEKLKSPLYVTMSSSKTAGNAIQVKDKQSGNIVWHGNKHSVETWLKERDLL